MLRLFALITLLFAAAWVTANAIPMVVDCGAGQSGSTPPLTLQPDIKS